MTAQVVPIARAALDVEALLAPISAENPAGEWLRFDAVFDDIQKLRQEDDPGLPVGVWQRELKKADWRGVEQVCIDVLTTRSKDLQVAAWLTEAWLHLYGFTGFAAGVRVMAGLCRNFWEGLYPPFDPESPDYRLAPVGWLTRLAIKLQSVPLTVPAPEETTAYAWKEWLSAQHLAKLAVKDQAALAKAQQRGEVTQAKFLVAVSLTPGPWYASMNEELTSALAALGELDAVLDEKSGAALAPSLSPLREVLQAVQMLVARVIRERIEKGELAPAPLPSVDRTTEPAMSEESTEAAAETPSANAAAIGPISSRAEAYRALSTAAEYLMRTEPHSPVPYLVRRAIAWGNMSLVELLEELLQKNADINTVYALLGMKRPG
ncbi:MAG TPA: type VI secretion system protein TssA [Thermoanaerobaculia bacterium]|nr:type VI secretion system protein TssA [Thermoanaerobaculia bacterium]